ncbi:hypothetical protein APR41_13680 [Salegentibacter salinarum]|uniref:Uncharacterized protein n=1 Tax=Salegentibacter salinarum TaxID=447422 RepID=A0A2N0U142_9FLAO|nr:hypothetical protein [Salegentibacter salinarum]PKD20717.1 hypothetical protein APR41_13680 [Salegentibacter salinarum]SKB81812.1 hypothetical protein SAMN05660903_02698 [Salegentibacter salinarum]
MKKTVFIICISLLWACNEKPQTVDNKGRKLDSIALHQPIGTTNEEVILLPEARKHAINWLAYIAAQNEVDQLKNYNLQQTIESSKPISQVMESLSTSIPDSLSSNAVMARANVLTTKAKVLEQLSHRRQLDAEAITEVAREIPLEFNNFKIQLNELFLKTLEDFEDELDEFKAERDTISIDSLPEAQL